MDWFLGSPLGKGQGHLRVLGQRPMGKSLRQAEISAQQTCIVVILAREIIRVGMGAAVGPQVVPPYSGEWGAEMCYGAGRSQDSWALQPARKDVW